MSKLISVFLVLLVVSICPFSCGPIKESDIKNITNPTYVEDFTKTIPVLIQPSDIIDTLVHKHVFTKCVNEPSCVKEGFTLYSCDCGYEYSDDYVAKSGHKWSEWNVVYPADFLKDGLSSKKCLVCGADEKCTISKRKICNDTNIKFNCDEDFLSLITYPNEEDFGKHYEHAVKLYNALCSNSTEFVYLFFDNENHKLEMQDFQTFKSVFEDKVLKNKSSIFMRSFTTGAFPEGTGLTRINIIPSDTIEMYELCHDMLNAAGIRDGFTTLQAVTNINQYMIDTLVYEKGYSKVMDVLKKNKAQCAGYARLFAYLCKHIGIRAEYVVGCTDGKIKGQCTGCHAWNRVLLGGEWYFIDVCWNDSNIQNKYFLTKSLWEPRTVYSIEDCT